MESLRVKWAVTNEKIFFLPALIELLNPKKWEHWPKVWAESLTVSHLSDTGWSWSGTAYAIYIVRYHIIMNSRLLIDCIVVLVYVIKPQVQFNLHIMLWRPADFYNQL